MAVVHNPSGLWTQNFPLERRSDSAHLRNLPQCRARVSEVSLPRALTRTRRVGPLLHRVFNVPTLGPRGAVLPLLTTPHARRPPPCSYGVPLARPLCIVREVICTSLSSRGRNPATESFVLFSGTGLCGTD